MTSLIKLLARPQFANLKSFTMPTHMKLKKTTLKQISKACPMLEGIDFGYDEATTCVNVKDRDLVECTELFANLKSVRFDMVSKSS